MRNLFLFLSLLCVVAVSLTITNCGSSSSAGNCTTPNPVYDLAGDWTITISGNGGSVSGAGVINTSGLAVFFQTTNTVPAPGDTAVLPASTGG